MAITSYKAVVGYYNSAGTPNITAAVTGQLSGGWIPVGAPILTDAYGQCTQMMVKTDASPVITTSAYTVVTAANPQPPDATWDAQGEPLWIDTTTYLQAYTKGGAYLQGVVPVSRGGTGATNAAAARVNLQLDRIRQFDYETSIVAQDGTTYIYVSPTSWGAYSSVNGMIPLAVAQGGTGATNAAAARTNLELGTVATLNTVPLANGGTGATNASDARNNLGLGSVATLNTVPLTNGGTGATNAAAARTNLELGTVATLNTVPVAQGGTGATEASGARNNLGLGSVATLNTVPVAQGGTGATNAAAARTNLELGTVATLNNIPLANGGTGATNASDARNNLGLGSAATLNTGNNNGNVMKVGDFGLGRPDGAYNFDTTSQDVLLAGLSSNGLTVFRNNQQIAAPWDIWNYSPSLFLRTGDTYGMISIPFESAGKIKVFGGAVGIGWKTGRTIYDTVNTTVDPNGFLKAASPIVKVFSDGRFETNEQSDGVAVERVSVGVYKISGVLGLNSEALWGGVNGGFEIPVDVNKQARIWLDYEVHADGSIVMKTYHRTHDSSPSFATNTIDGFNNGDPIDIPSDAFVSVRVNMP